MHHKYCPKIYGLSEERSLAEVQELPSKGELKRQGLVRLICNTCTTGNTSSVTSVVGEEG